MTAPARRVLSNDERMHGRVATTGERKAAGRRRHDRGVMWLSEQLCERGFGVWREALIRRNGRGAIDLLVFVDSRPVAVVEHRFRLKTRSDADWIEISASNYSRRAESEWGYATLPFMTAGAIERPAVARASELGVLPLRDAPDAIAAWFAVWGVPA